MSDPASASRQRHVVVIVYPDVMAMDVCGPMEAFSMANFLSNRGLYRLSIAAVTADPVMTSLGFCIVPNNAWPVWKAPLTRFWLRGDTVMSTPCATGR